MSTFRNRRVAGFQLPSSRDLFVKARTVLVRRLAATTACGTSWGASSVLCSNSWVSFRKNSSCGIVCSRFPRAREWHAFTSATEHMKVNGLIGHHFIAQTSSNPIGSCRRLLWSSTQCFALLYLENGSVYLNDFHRPSTFRGTGKHVNRLR